MLVVMVIVALAKLVADEPQLGAGTLGRDRIARAKRGERAIKGAHPFVVQRHGLGAFMT